MLGGGGGEGKEAVKGTGGAAPNHFTKNQFESWQVYLSVGGGGRRREEEHGVRHPFSKLYAANFALFSQRINRYKACSVLLSARTLFYF